MPKESNPLSVRLKALLQLKTGGRGTLRNRENSQLEFKETFNLGSLGKYARSLAAFANNRGGYIVFGVTNEPRRLKGLNVKNFESCDPARLTEFFNSHFSPELEWEMETVDIGRVLLGYLYAHQCRDKPVVTIATSGSDIREAAIYYRYRGQTAAIKFPELRGILEERIARERRAWMQHLTSIGRAGPTNVGVIDTVRGKLFGGGPPFLIDESLLRKLKFVRAGQFSEKEGAPALRLVGDLQPVAGVVAEKPIHVGIHADDLITAFLAQRPLDPTQAATYLRETIFHASLFAPIHYFFRKSGLSEGEVRNMFKDAKAPMASTRARVLQRLFGGDRIAAMGAVDNVASLGRDLTGEQFMSNLGTQVSARSKRTLLLTALRRDPRLIEPRTPSLNVALLAEAVTHLTKNELATHEAQIMETLLLVFELKYGAMKPIERTKFRKAVCHCDELMFAA